MASQSVEIGFLRRFVVQALAIVEERFPNGIPLHETRYWEVPITKQFEVQNSQVPPEVTMGDLSDDIEFLTLAMKSGGQVLPASLVHLVGLLNYVAIHAQDGK